MKVTVRVGVIAMARVRRGRDKQARVTVRASYGRGRTEKYK